MKVILLSNPRSLESEPELITDFFQNGLDIFHLRKPGKTEKEITNFILRIPRKFWSRIVIHSHHNIARKLPIKGIHITGKHDKKRFRTWLTIKRLRFKRPGIHISKSVHSLEKLYDIKNEFDYLFISPVFDSISKGGYQSGYDQYGLSMAIKEGENKVIALGGVDETKIDQISEMGFYGFALMGAIWKSKNKLDTFIAIRKRIMSDE